MKNADEGMVYVKNSGSRPVVVRAGRGDTDASDAVRVWSADNFMIEALPDRAHVTRLPADAWERWTRTEFGKALLATGALTMATRAEYESQPRLPWEAVEAEEQAELEAMRQEADHAASYRQVPVR
ncbi:hypothetical protein AB4Y42_10820 [Paraburkholderia sp. EG286B]|uniref:hypothetical protein n=1 Tax=Paraburkholderia sp. EG286B TaxID=3237011 RepID=UPI0034D2517B